MPHHCPICKRDFDCEVEDGFGMCYEPDVLTCGNCIANNPDLSGPTK